MRSLAHEPNGPMNKGEATMTKRQCIAWGAAACAGTYAVLVAAEAWTLGVDGAKTMALLGWSVAAMVGMLFWNAPRDCGAGRKRGVANG